MLVSQKRDFRAVHDARQEIVPGPELFREFRKGIYHRIHFPADRPLRLLKMMHHGCKWNRPDN
jgi:hypothetical protein